MPSASVVGLDPVCAMTVKVREARATERVVEYGGRAYVFCSEGCRAEFEAAPDYYAALAAAEGPADDS